MRFSSRQAQSHRIKNFLIKDLRLGMLVDKYPTFQVYMLVAEHRDHEKIFKAVLTARIASLSGLKPRLFPTYRIP